MLLEMFHKCVHCGQCLRVNLSHNVSRHIMTNIYAVSLTPSQNLHLSRTLELPKHLKQQGCTIRFMVWRRFCEDDPLTLLSVPQNIRLLALSHVILRLAFPRILSHYDTSPQTD